MFNNDYHKDRDYCCTPPVRKAGPYCGPVDTTPVGKPYNSHADCHHKPDCGCHIPPVPPFPPDCHHKPDCGYHIPPVPPFPPGTSLEFQMQALNHKMDELICKYNGCLDNYECVRNELLNSFCCNEAYYNEIWTEDYLDPTMNTNVHVVHVPFVDKCGRPIRLKLGLAYDNTGNIGATEEAYHASKRVLADKLFPANFTEKNTKAFVGPCIWNGVPYNFGNTVSTMSQLTPTNTLGITRSGFLKVYPITTDVNTQVVTIEQMQRDGIENAMDCLAYVLDSKAVESASGLTGPFVGVGMEFSTKERVIILVSGTPNAVSGDAISGLFTKYHCTVGVITCWGETASLMDKGQFVAMPATVETSSTNPATQIVPYYNSFWYISKSEYYNSEYTKEVADLMQDVGALEWKYNMSMVAIESNNRVVAELNQKIETEITDRKEADTTLENRITQEVAELNSRIDEEVKTLNESITTVQKNLDDAVETINTRIDSEVEKLNQAIQAEETRAEAAESALDEKIQAETTRATEAETNLDNKIQAETTRATEAEKDLDEKIDAETNARQEAVNSEAATRAANDIVSVELIQDGTKNTYRLKTGGDTYLEVPIELYDYALLVSKMQDLTNVQQNLAAEVEARQTADDEIRSSVTKEASTRQTEDTKLQNQIDGLTEKQDDYVLKAGDTMTGDLNMGTHKVTGLATPTGNTDAATKQYVDNATRGDYLPTAGGTMQGVIDMNGNAIQNVKDPINAQDAANKEYVDAIGEGVGKNFLPTAGGTMTGPIRTEYFLENYPQFYAGPKTPINRAGTPNKESVFSLGASNTGGFEEEDTYVTLSLSMTDNNAYLDLYKQAPDASDQSYLVGIGGVNDPENEYDAANKKYVDESVKGYLPIRGGTLTGALNMGNHSILNCLAYNLGLTHKLQLVNYEGVKAIAALDNNAPAYIRALGLIATSFTEGFSDGDVSLKIQDHNIVLSKISDGKLTVDNTGEAGVTLTGVNYPVNPSDAANKQYVDDKINTVPVTTPITIFPLSTDGRLSLVSQSGKIEDKTGVIYATAQYKVVSEISGVTIISLQNTVSGEVIPTNITGVVNACIGNGPGKMSAMKAAFYQGWTYLYTDGTLPVDEFIYINFMGFKEV